MDPTNATVGQVMTPVDDFEAGTAFYRDVLGLPFLCLTPARRPTS
jgi:catechol 2,3-dioxygenase-like lactoylglutathione lyase family enzyme